MSLVLVAPYPFGTGGAGEVITFDGQPVAFDGQTLVLGAAGAGQLSLKPGAGATLRPDGDELILEED